MKNNMKTMKTTIAMLLLTVATIIGTNLKAQNPGQVDLTFTAAFPASPTSVNQVIELTNKQIIARADDANSIGLFKFNADGSPDLNFNYMSYGLFNNMDYANNKIVLSTLDSVFLLNENGTRVWAKQFSKTSPVRKVGKVFFATDSTILVNIGDTIKQIDINGNFNTQFTMYKRNGQTLIDIEIQNDGKILLGLSNNVVRLNSNGTVDNTFSNPSSMYSSFDIQDLDLQSDGKIIIAGNVKYASSLFYSYIGRLNSDGTKDATFATSINNQLKAVKVQSDDKIVCAGYFTLPKNKVVRLNANGSTDNTFDVGTGASLTGMSLEIQSNGKVLVGGNFTSFNGTTCDKLVRLYGDNNLKADVCIVTVDSTTGKNLVVWEKEYGLNIRVYKIYKQNTSGSYVYLDSLSFGATETKYIDNASNPQVKAERYTITAVDSNGVESPIQTNGAYKTIHLSVNIGITQGTYNLIWDDFEGFNFTTYYIYRITTTGVTLIDSVAKSNKSYTDFAPLGTLSYIVSVKKLGGCDATKSSTYSSSISNIKQLPLTTGVIENEAKLKTVVYPNPSNGVVNIEFELDEVSDVVIQVTNIMGQIIEQIEYKSTNSGINKTSVDVSEKVSSKGIYMIKISANNKQVVQRITIQ